jgi:hypothetical protein
VFDKWKIIQPRHIINFKTLTIVSCENVLTKLGGSRLEDNTFHYRFFEVLKSGLCF